MNSDSIVSIRIIAIIGIAIPMVFFILFSFGYFSGITWTWNTGSFSNPTTSGTLTNVNLNAYNSKFVYYIGLSTIAINDAEYSVSNAFEYYNSADSLTTLTNLYSGSAESGSYYTAVSNIVVNASAYKSSIDNQYQNISKSLESVSTGANGIGYNVNYGSIVLSSTAPITANYTDYSNSLNSEYITNFHANLTSPSQSLLIIEAEGYGITSASLPSDLNCSQSYDIESSYAYNIYDYVYLCHIANGYNYAYVNVNTSTTSFSGLPDYAFVINGGYTLFYNFTSSFSYISPLGSNPYCSYSYSILPNVFLNGQNVNSYITAISKSDIYNWNNANTNAPLLWLSYFGMNLTTNKVLPQFNEAHIYPYGYAPYVFIGAQNLSKNITMAGVNIMISKNSTITMKSDITTIYNSEYVPFNFNPFGNNVASGIYDYNNDSIWGVSNTEMALFGLTYRQNYNDIGDYYQIPNTNSTKSYPLTNAEIFLDIPINNSLYNLSQINIQNAFIQLASSSNTTKVRFAWNGKTWINFLKIPISANEISVDKRYIPNAIMFEIPLNLSLIANTTGLSSGYTYATPSIEIENITFDFSYPIRYEFSKQFSQIPSSATWNFSLSNLYLNQMNQNYYTLNTTINSSDNYYVPSAYIEWTYNPVAYYTLDFNTFVNNQIWTANSKIEYQNANYTANSNGYISIPNVKANSQIPFTTYYYVNNRWYSTNNYVITSVFNPCKPIKTYSFSIYTNIYVNGTTTSNTTCATGSYCGSSGGSSSTSIPPTSSNSSTNSTTIFKSVNTPLGISPISLGIFSFIFTADFWYLAIILGAFAISEYYIRRSKFGIVLFLVLVLIGIVVGLIPLFISLLTLLILGAYMGIQYAHVLRG